MKKCFLAQMYGSSLIRCSDLRLADPGRVSALITNVTKDLQLRGLPPLVTSRASGADVGVPAGWRGFRAGRVQAWRVGDERAETYLRLLAEVELRRAGDQLRGLDAAAGMGEWSDPGMAPFAAAESAQWRVVRAGWILVAAGALDREFLDRFAGELFSAITVRSRIVLSWYRGRGVLHTVFAPPGGRALPSGRVSWAIRVTPIGRALRVASGRAPSVLHFMSLVRAGGGAVITMVMRVRWPSDWLGTDREITEASPVFCPTASTGGSG